MHLKYSIEIHRKIVHRGKKYIAWEYYNICLGSTKDFVYYLYLTASDIAGSPEEKDSDIVLVIVRKG